MSGIEGKEYKVYRNKHMIIHVYSKIDLGDYITLKGDKTTNLFLAEDSILKEKEAARKPLYTFTALTDTYPDGSKREHVYTLTKRASWRSKFNKCEICGEPGEEAHKLSFLIKTSWKGGEDLSIGGWTRGHKECLLKSRDGFVSC